MSERAAVIFAIIGWALLFAYVLIDPIIAAVVEQRRQRREATRASTAPIGNVCCPNCRTWNDELPAAKQPVWSYVRDERPGMGAGGYDLMNCRVCGSESAWIDGPGLMLNIAIPAPVHGLRVIEGGRNREAG